MRASGIVFAAIAAALVGASRLVAQDEPDSAPPSVQPDSEWVDEPFDPPGPRSRDENPYLREVDRAAYTPRRGPFWASFGLGAGSEAIADLGAPAPYTPTRVRPTLSLAFGGTVNQQLRVGIDGFAWFNLLRDGTLESITVATVGARLYPVAASGLYLRAGGGFGRYGQDLSDDCGCNTALVSDYGWAWVVGAGYELPVGRGLWLGPNLELVRMNVTGPGGYRERVLNFGITLTYDGK